MASQVHCLIKLVPGTNLGAGQPENAVQGDGVGRWRSWQDSLDGAGKLLENGLSWTKLTGQFTMSSFVEVRLSQVYLAWTLTYSTMIRRSKIAIGNNGWWTVSHVC